MEINTLFELSFKVSAIIIQNFIRRLFAVDPNRNIIEWHFLEFLMARTTLIRDFGIPPSFVEALLPRFPSRLLPLHPYPVQAEEGVCTITKIVILKYIIICLVKILVCLTDSLKECMCIDAVYRVLPPGE